MVCRSLVLCRSRTLSCGASVAPVNAQHGTPTNGQPTEAVTFDGRQARLLDGELALEAGILNHNLYTEYFLTEKEREYGFADQEFIG